LKNINLNARREHRILRVLATLTLVAVALSACGKSADEYISRAQARRDKGEIPAAVIELKNALQKEPKNLTARVMLGQTYLDLSDPVNAEADLLRARADGADAAVLAKPLAQAELELGKLDKALSESEFPPNASPALKASLDSIRGMAYATQGKSTAADDAFAAGLKEDPHSADLLVALVRYAVARHDVPATHERLAQALNEAPKDIRVVALKGTVAFADGDFGQAEEAFTQVTKTQPWNLGARTDLAQAQIAAGKLKEADANLAIVLKASPKAARPNYFRALDAYRAQDYATASTSIQNVLSVSKDNATALLLAGAISYALNQFEQANSYLSYYVARVPNDVRGLQLLGAVQIRLGRPADAVKTLSPAVAAGGDNAQLLALIGEAAARSGDTLGAEKYLTQALTQQPDNAAVRTELGLSKAALGETDAAIEEFEKASKVDPNSLGPDAALFATYERTGDFDKALAVAEGLKAKQPTKPLGFDLAGVAQLAKGDRAAAQSAWSKARELSPQDALALRGLAALAVQDGKLDVATGYYETLVQANPKDTQASIGLARLQLQTGKPDAAKATLQTAIDQNPDATPARVGLARFLLSQRKNSDALSVAEDALAKNPRDPEVLAVVAAARLAVGQVDKALATFKLLLNIAPQSGEAHRETALAYAAMHDNERALTEARTAVELAPDDRAAKLTFGSFLIAARNFDEARPRVDEWAAAAPQDAGLAELQGVIASAQNRTQDALDAFQRAVAVQDTNVGRMRLAEMQDKVGQADAAEKTLTSWLDTHPDDAVARNALAQHYLAEKQTAKARDQYAQILQQVPNDVAIENNLAWTMSLLGQKDDALRHAQHAAAAAPNAPGVLDTLGVILLQNGKTSEAREALEKAAKGAPEVASIQFHFAQALEQTGAKDKARDALRSALLTKNPFDERDQAQKLLAELGN
jgi:putative PEP-CTERM system TPR-repeat lipoprotein